MEKINLLYRASESIDGYINNWFDWFILLSRNFDYEIHNYGEIYEFDNEKIDCDRNIFICKYRQTYKIFEFVSWKINELIIYRNYQYIHFHLSINYEEK